MQHEESDASTRSRIRHDNHEKLGSSILFWGVVMAWLRRVIVSVGVGGALTVRVATLS